MTRSDAGTMRCSARDVELLRFVGEQYAVTLPQLARLMGCSSHAARWLRSRWERAGWARGGAMLVGEPVFVWLTRRGHGIAGIDYAVWRPNLGMLAHFAAVTDVRLDVTARHPGAAWVCERELHCELGSSREAGCGRMTGGQPSHGPYERDAMRFIGLAAVAAGVLPQPSCAAARDAACSAREAGAG